MSSFINYLEGLNQSDSRVRATLRRSLAFTPGEYVPAFPYVEIFLKSDTDDWRRKAFYLVAGLWAMHWREGRSGLPLTIGKACAALDCEKRGKLSQEDRRKTSNTEKRFITLIDSDTDQLPHRLRQMIALLKEQTIDYDVMLNDLFLWNKEQKQVQHAWARQFYKQLNQELEIETLTEEENP